MAIHAPSVNSSLTFAWPCMQVGACKALPGCGGSDRHPQPGEFVCICVCCLGDEGGPHPFLSPDSHGAEGPHVLDATRQAHTKGFGALHRESNYLAEVEATCCKP